MVRIADQLTGPAFILIGYSYVYTFTMRVCLTQHVCCGWWWSISTDIGLAEITHEASFVATSIDSLLHFHLFEKLLSSPMVTGKLWCALVLMILAPAKAMLKRPEVMSIPVGGGNAGRLYTHSLPRTGHDFDQIFQKYAPFWAQERENDSKSFNFD